jgi:hypothetical protein
VAGSLGVLLRRRVGNHMYRSHQSRTAFLFIDYL